MTETMKPAPHPSPLTQPYWDGTAAGVLRFQTCAACGKARHYPRYICDVCGAFDVVWQDSSGLGTVHSWTVAHHAFHPGFKDELPYALVTVDMAEGIRALGRYAVPSGEGLRVGRTVRVTFTEGGGGYMLPLFVPEGD
jgi:uncharacterized OB-fold protein